MTIDTLYTTERASVVVVKNAAALLSSPAVVKDVISGLVMAIEDGATIDVVLRAVDTVSWESQ